MIEKDDFIEDKFYNFCCKLSPSLCKVIGHLVTGIYLYPFFLGSLTVHSFALMFFSWYHILLMSACIHLLLLFETKGEFDGSKEWPLFRRFTANMFRFSFFVHPWHSTFPTYESICQNKKPKRVLFACHPHGVIPISWAISFAGMNPYRPVFLVAKVIFRIPITRFIALWFGCLHASNKALTLTQERNAIVLPGGLREMSVSSYDGEIIVIKRKGFIRSALKNPGGMAIVPVFGFGVEKLHSQLIIANEWMKKKFGFFPFLTFGAIDFMYPKHAKVCHISGKPLFVEYCPDFNEDQVSNLYDKFYSEMENIIESHKKECPFHSSICVKFIDSEKMTRK